jgi:hypothetical protein
MGKKMNSRTKRKIVVISIVIIILLGFVLLFKWMLTPVKPENMIAYININDKVITVQVDSYQRISSQWIKIVASDGNVYQVNERNVVLEGK